LVVGHLAGLRNADGWFATADAAELFEAFRVPPPKNVPATIASLAKAGLIYRRTKQPPWSLAPKGRRTVSDLLGDLDPAKLETQLADVPGAELADTRQPVLPPELGPPRWATGIRELLSRSPFETNVFCMTRFPREGNPDDPNAEVIATAREALRGHGLKLYLASDAIVEDTLFANIAAYMWGCQYGLALFEDRVGEGLTTTLSSRLER
jgi:hypothetical protein